MALAFDAPLPSGSGFIQAVRTSCAAARKASDISISDEAIDAFVRGLDEARFNRLKSEHGVSFPLTFPSPASEINFLSILALLNTLSAYRRPFHEVTGQGAYQNVVRLLMGMYISSPDSDTSPDSKLSAQGMANLTDTDVASLLNVSLLQERPHETIPGLVVGSTRGGPLLEPIQLVVQICNDTGKRLLDVGAPNLGTFVARLLIEAGAEADRNGDAAGCDLFVAKLVAALPGFADMTTLPTSTPPKREPVYLFKKAFFLLFALKVRLNSATSSSDAPGIRVPDIASLPMFVDNVIPTMLVHYKIIQFGEASPEVLRAWGSATADAAAATSSPVEGPSLSKEDAYRVRAAALDAGTAIVRRIQALVAEDSKLAWLAQANEVDIDGYLWAVAKDDPALRAVPRLVERGTVMY